MATPIEYIDFVCEQIKDSYNVRYKKMFGEYMVYINEKPLLLVCDSTVFIKKNQLIQEKMINEKTGFPYPNAKEHYILDIDNSSFCNEIIAILDKSKK